MRKDIEMRVLIVDDDEEFVSDFSLLLPTGFKSESVSSADSAMSLLEISDFDVAFLDIDLGSGGNGIELLQQMKKKGPFLPVIMITADTRTDTVVKAMRYGASDYVGKSPNMNDLQLSVDRAIRECRLRQDVELLKTEVEELTGDLIGDSPAMSAVKQEIARIAPTPSNVLITGESGTGKELAAREIHKHSAVSNEPFVAVNCAALSRELFESELFGHEKGAFTGATNKRRGKFEIVGQGTLFLDEITEIPPELQAKLLRVLQEREFERVGGDKLIPFRGRLLASSNRDLEKALKENLLREDLYYRINVTSIHMPKLADRKEDIPLLVNHFIKMKATEMKKAVSQIDRQAMDFLTSRHWQGNVRQLANCIESAIVHCDGTSLELHHFARLSNPDRSGSEITKDYEEAKRQVLDKFQREFITAALMRNNGNTSAAAREMGVSRQGLVKMMKACGLQ